MKNERKEFSTLLDRYRAVRESLMDYTMNYFDAMGYDISGYSSTELEDEIIYIDDLRNQVEAFELILEGLSKKNYIFG
jgi:hypothetical protein